MRLRPVFVGVLLIIASLSLYIVLALISVVSHVISYESVASQFGTLATYCVVFIVVGLLLVLWDLLYLKKDDRVVQNLTVGEGRILSVVLTAYNDELSIKDAVNDFKMHPSVKRVIVISNNSTDKTMQNAEEAGALVFNETLQGYGACVYRALQEGVNQLDTELTLLCEGDCTFKAHDIPKFLAYLPHADIVNGSRIVEQLRSGNTQLSSFMFYGNFFVGKLLEFKHVDHGTFTDVGTTYKLCRNSVLKNLLPKLNPKINLEFNPYFLDIALQNQAKIVECPVTFYPRVGFSKGGNVNNKVAFRLGLRMMRGLIFGWR